MTSRYKCTIAYDGTAYAGWQVQPKHRTIQAEIEKAVHQITGEQVRIHSSGRTDSGVHARGQSAHFDLQTPVDLFKFNLSLNAMLDADIRMLKIQKCASDFHARYDAKSKEYRYHIYNSQWLMPFLRNYRLHVRKPLNTERMQQAADHLVGEHDFAAFSANPKREIDGTVREIYRLTVKKQGPEITIQAVGNGFLYKMVRSLAGFLIRVGEGALPPESAVEIRQSKERTARVPSAQPQGLFLLKVNY